MKKGMQDGQLLFFQSPLIINQQAVKANSNRYRKSPYQITGLGDYNGV